MVRWGIIGPGAIAHAFANEIGNTENGKLVSVYGRSRDKSEKFADEYNIDKVYCSIDEFLNDNDMDAVYIATPHNYHMEFAEKCIYYKKHVLCEKPFSYNYESSKRILDLAKGNNIFVMEALWTMFLPAIKKAKSWIDSNEIGKVKLITANFGFKGDGNPDSRLYSPELAGGALLDVGIYTLLISDFIMNSVCDKITSNAVMTKTGVDETDVINLEYSNGAVASLTCSIACDTDNSAVIYGDKGKIVIPDFSKAKTAYLYTNEKEEKFEDKYSGTGYKYEIIEAGRCIENNLIESTIASHEMTLNLAYVMDEIRNQIGLVYPFE
ncbi:MAG: Gfo/Idh/MocA family protein [Clostridium sp.]